jgi:hypothetical protein
MSNQLIALKDVHKNIRTNTELFLSLLTIARHCYGNVQVNLKLVVDKGVNQELVVVPEGQVVFDFAHHQDAQDDRDHQGQDASRPCPFHKSRLDFGEGIKLLELHLFLLVEIGEGCGPKKSSRCGESELSSFLDSA